MENNSKTGILYIVATPIGNLEDMTLRAMRVIGEVDIVFAEDTRVSKKLIDFVSSRHSQPVTHNPQLKSYHQHSSDAHKAEILNLLLMGKNLALVTDAGTPGISDPGNELVDFIQSQNPSVEVIPIPGPSALTSALSVCGFDTTQFFFTGFLPKKKRLKLLNWLKDNKLTFAYFDSPFRYIKNLKDIQSIFGDEVRVLVARELTKLHERSFRGKIGEVIEKCEQDDKRGEVVVVVGKN